MGFGFARTQTMDLRLPLRVRALIYELRGGFLVRPFVIALTLGAAGVVLPVIEERYPALAAWAPSIVFPSPKDAQVAQMILSVIATSIMTVVSVVFAIVLMSLTLASSQFSPRILVTFVRDRATQWTLGVLLGTFAYCVAVLPATRTLPVVLAPVVSVFVAMVLALASIAWLIFFIHHIAESISVSHIVDRIGRETELTIDGLMPYEITDFETADLPPMDDAGSAPVASRRTGYIRYIDIARLLQLAKAWRIRLRVERRVGQFIPAGVPLVRVSRDSRVPPERAAELLAAIDIGPTRTLQQDVEFGVVQIVDIALRAISPAVNDPSTAITCIDQLSSILILWCARKPPPAFLADPPHVPRVEIPWIDLDGLLNLAFEQIRHYAVGDLAVNLRLLRAMGDIAVTTRRNDVHVALRRRARLLVERAADAMPQSDAARLHERFEALEARLSEG